MARRDRLPAPRSAHAPLAHQRREREAREFRVCHPGATRLLGLLPRRLLAKLESDSDHFFASGKAKPQTARANWSRYLDTVFAAAKVDGAHSHRFRDTFAVSLLEAGVSIDNVSVLLGHSSVRITERHYTPWVKSLQKKLEDEVRKAWVK